MRNQYRGDYLQHWNATATGEDGAGAVDVILCPVGPGAAPPLDNAKYWGYTSQWNLLDYPSLSFPVSCLVVARIMLQGWWQSTMREQRMLI